MYVWLNECSTWVEKHDISTSPIDISGRGGVHPAQLTSSSQGLLRISFVWQNSATVYSYFTKKVVIKTVTKHASRGGFNYLHPLFSMGTVNSTFNTSITFGSLLYLLEKIIHKGNCLFTDLVYFIVFEGLTDFTDSFYHFFLLVRHQ